MLFTWMVKKIGLETAIGKFGALSGNDAVVRTAGLNFVNNITNETM